MQIYKTFNTKQIKFLFLILNKLQLIIEISLKKFAFIETLYVYLW